MTAMELLGRIVCKWKGAHSLKRRKATQAEIYAFLPQTGYPVKMVRQCQRCGFLEAVVARRGRVPSNG